MSQQEQTDYSKLIEDFKNDNQPGNEKFLKEAFDFGSDPDKHAEIFVIGGCGSVSEQAELIERIQAAVDAGMTIVIDGGRASMASLIRAFEQVPEEKKKLKESVYDIRKLEAFAKEPAPKHFTTPSPKFNPKRNRVHSYKGRR